MAGAESWNGRWSKDSDCWDQLPQDQWPKNAKEGAESGLFWISLQDFLALVNLFKLQKNK